MSDQVAVAKDLAECLPALCARSWTIRLMQVMTVFSFVICEGLIADAAELVFRVPLLQLAIFQSLKELGDIPARSTESWITGWKIGLRNPLELVPGMIILCIMVADETSFQIHHLGNKPFPVF